MALDSIAKHIEKLLAFNDGYRQPFTSILVLRTTNKRVASFIDGTNTTVWRCPHGALQPVDKSEDYFSKLQMAGYSWINVSLYGICDTKLIVGIELPSGGPVGLPPGKTAINYSGPTVDVSTGDTICMVSIENDLGPLEEV